MDYITEVFANLGIQLADNEGNYKSIDTVLNELSQIWDKVKDNI